MIKRSQFCKKTLLVAITSLCFNAPIWVATGGNAPALLADSGTRIPLNSWTMLPTNGFAEQIAGYGKLVYSSGMKKSLMFENYHQLGTEPNEAMLGYDFAANRWDVLSYGGNAATDNTPEAGHPSGMLAYDSNNNVILSYCCWSTAQEYELGEHMWWFDPAGQVGRKKQAPTRPGEHLQAAATFDPVHDVYVYWDGGAGTWTYSPGTNTWSPQSPTGTPPITAAGFPSMAFNSADHKVYMLGGDTEFSDALYTYDVGANVWTRLVPTGALPPVREYAPLAYDSLNNIFLTFGGSNKAGTLLTDTWVYNPSANSWTQLSPAVSPPVPPFAPFGSLTYDSDNNVFVMVAKGPNGYVAPSPTGGTQTWLFRYAGAGPNAGTVNPTFTPTPGSINRNTDGWAKEPALASSGSSLYLGWSEVGKPSDGTAGAWPHAYVNQLSGGNWQALGKSFTALDSEANGYSESHSPSMAVVANIPWISWYKADNSVGFCPPSGCGSGYWNLYAKYWNGSVWVGGPVGSGATTALGPYSYFITQGGRSQMTAIGSTPYIAFLESDRSFYPWNKFVYVKSWNGSGWTLKGTGPLNRVTTTSGDVADSISITSDGTNPIVAWTEYSSTFFSANPPQVFVSKWTGSSWSAIGGSVNVSTSNWAYEASITYLNNQPYVAWTERTQGGNTQLYVKTWHGSSWVLVGSGSLNRDTNTGWSYRPSLTTDGTNLFVGWVEQQSLGQKPQMYVATYIGGLWSSLGSSLNADTINGSAEHASLAILNNQPVASWGEVNAGSLRQVFVKQWTGSAWASPAAVVIVADTQAPSVPVGLNATATSASQISLSWTASTDNIAVSGYQVFRNGVQVATTIGASYSDSGLEPSTSYSYRVAASDAAGNISAPSTAASDTTFSVDTTLPYVSIVSPVGTSPVSGTLIVTAFATDNVGVAGIQFKLDGNNLGAEALLPTGTAYSISWNTIGATNGIHALTAVARDTSNNLSTSASVTVTVANTNSVRFLLSGEPTEISGTTDGSVVTPAVGPQGVLRVVGLGAVHFTPALVNSGVYFSACCGASGVAYYKFAGAQLGDIFDASRAREISFNLKSLKSWVLRATEPSYNYRMIFNVEADTATATNYSYFYITASSGRLVLGFNHGSTSGRYYLIPAGQEEILFGKGAILTVRIAWDGSTVNLYLNGSLVAGPYTYTPTNASWNSSSVLVLSGDAYFNSVYDVSDDIAVDEFRVE